MLVDDRRGKRSQVFVDESGRLSKVISPLGRAHRFSYDDANRVTGVLEPNGLQTLLSYRADGLPGSVTRGEGRRWTYDWDAQANLTRLTLPDGTQCAASYAEGGKLSSSARGPGQPIVVEYDEHGRPSALVEATGARTAFEYSLWDRPDRAVRADGSVEQVVRDGAGRLTSASVDDEPWYDAEYDEKGRVTAIHYADGHFVTEVRRSGPGRRSEKPEFRRQHELRRSGAAGFGTAR
ncbi:MAG: hypothetical protein ABI548_22450 [Polyangiaceae bacterium]